MSDTLNYLNMESQVDLDEPSTTESDFELADIGQRIGARCIDFIVWLCLTVLVYLLVLWVAFEFHNTSYFGTFPNEKTMLEVWADLNNTEPRGYLINLFGVEGPRIFTREQMIVLPYSWIFVWIFLLLQGKLLAKYGQTIGKLNFNIVIVDRVTREKLPFGKLYLKRYLVFDSFLLFGWLLGLIFRLIDFAFLFRKDRRTIRDLVANTVVIKQKI